MHSFGVRFQPLLTRWAAAAVLLTCSSAQAVNGNCEFRVVGTLTMNFTIDPSVDLPVVASVMPGQPAEIGNCRSVTMSVTADGGSNWLDGRRHLAQAGGGLIPYTLTPPPAMTAPGNNRWVPLVITGTIAPADFQNARAGIYSDRVVITVSP